MRKIDTEHEMLIKDELTFLAGLVALESLDIIELGCGKADMARELLRRYPDARVTGLEVDQVQHAKNRANPQAGLTFVAAGAQAIPFAQARFDLAVMLKSLHHIPQALMKQALDDIARVLKPGGLLYVSEPVFAGSLNDISRLYNDEEVVRGYAQQALDEALLNGKWVQVAQERFDMPAYYKNFEDFEIRNMRPSFAEHKIDDIKLAQVKAVFDPYCGENGVTFDKPQHVRLLKRTSFSA